MPFALSPSKGELFMLRQAQHERVLSQYYTGLNNMECKLVKVIKINKERLFMLGQILETHVDADKIIDARRFKLDISKIDPLVYCARVREYWSVGKKLGDGYNAGKALIKNLEN